MSCIQVHACWPRTGLQSISSPLSQSSYLRTSYLYASLVHTFQHRKALPRLAYGSPKYQRSPVCLFGGKGKSDNDNEASPWKALEKALGGFRKERSVQDMLREQMKEREFDAAGGSGTPPGSGGGGGGSSGDSEDEGFAGILDELLQVVLATIGFIFVYIYVIRGEEMTRLAKDYVKYLFGASPSVRLRRAMYVWGRFRQRVTRKKVVREDWLERAIVATPTWWHKPRQLARMMAADD